MTSSDTLTAPDLQEKEVYDMPSSGDVWEDLLGTKPLHRRGSILTRLAGSTVFALASTVTSLPLPPPPYNRRDETSSVISYLVAPQLRRITLYEARELALAAMEQAEQRRAAFAELQARLLAIWEEGG